MTERATLSADSAISANQTWLDDIANNLANTNTVGFKSETVQFSDLLAEQLSGTSAPPAGGGGAGINPISIGSGVTVSASSMDLSEGSLEQTGQSSDVAINGNGYLVVQNHGQQQYTRDGSLTIDANGNLATQDGGLIEGWQASGTGVLNTNAPLTGIKIPKGETIPAQATTQLALGGNLPAWNGIGTPPIETTTQNAFDSLGNAIPVTLTFTGVAGTANSWTVDAATVTPSGAASDLFTAGKYPVVAFNPSTGQVTSITIPATGTGTVTTNSDGSTSLGVGSMPTGYSFPAGDTWALNFPKAGSADAITQYAGQSTMQIESQDGHASGTLESYTIGGDGVVTGSFSSGTSLALGQIALANFANPTGLINQGGGAFATTSNSGQPQIGTPGSGGRGSLLGGQLEQSNVSLNTELTQLEVAQDAYTASTKPLTAEQNVLRALEQVQ